MKLFLKRKLEVLQQEAAYYKKPIVLLLWKKVVRKGGRMLLHLLEYPLLLLFVPVLWLLLKAHHVLSPKKQKRALFYGLEHVIHKVGLRGLALEKEGFLPSHYAAQDITVKTNYPLQLQPLSASILWNTLHSFSFLIKYKPIYAEIYTEGELLNQIILLLFSKAHRFYTVVVERGFLYQYLDNSFSFLFKKKLEQLYSLSDHIIYRETYMPELFEKIGIPAKKLSFDFNRVPVSPWVYDAQKGPVVLFLNGFKEWRNLHLLIQAIPQVLKKIPSAFFQMVGADQEEKRAFYIQQCKDLNIPASAYDFQFWTNEPQQYYAKAKIFVLPADLIFCNYSLLEAMERGVVPIVADVEDADKIVKDGVNGVTCPRNSEIIAEHIVDLLTQPAKCEQFAHAAREFIVNQYDDNDRMKMITDLLELN